MRNAPLMQAGDRINYGGEQSDNLRLAQAPISLFHQVLEQGLLRLLGHDVGEVFVLEAIDEA